VTLRPLAPVVAPAALFMVALALRLWGLDFGMPLASNLYVRPDETIVVIPSLLYFSNAGNPLLFAYPALLHLLFGLAFVLLHGIRQLAGMTAATGLVADFLSAPDPYFLTARAVSATVGAATAVLTFAVADRLVGRRVALVAAGLYAVAPLAVRDAHFAVTDTLASCLAVGTLLAVLLYVDGAAGGLRGRIAVGTTAGLALAAKYSVAPMLVVAVLAVTGADLARGEGLRRAVARGLGVACVALTVFAAINPWLLIEGSGNMATEVGAVFAFVYRSQPDAASLTLHGISELWRLLGHGPGGAAGTVLALFGVAIGLGGWRRRPGAAVAALALIACALPLVPATVLPFRYAVPLLPLAAVCLAVGLGHVAARIPRPTPRRLLWGAVVVAGTVGLAHSLSIDRLLARTDTRVLAGRWIEEHLPPGVPVILPGEPETEPQLVESAASLLRRVEFAERRYGAGPAEFITVPYRMALAQAPGASGRELYRQPAPREVPSGEVCLVVPSYPLPMAGDRHDLAQRLLTRGVVRDSVRIRGLAAGTDGLELDPTDAFFLPMGPLDRVLRPGPDLEIFILELPPPPSARRRTRQRGTP